MQVQVHIDKELQSGYLDSLDSRFPYGALNYCSSYDIDTCPCSIVFDRNWHDSDGDRNSDSDDSHLICPPSSIACPGKTYIKCPNCGGRTNYGAQPAACCNIDDAVIVYGCPQCLRFYLVHSPCYAQLIGSHMSRLMRLVESHTLTFATDNDGEEIYNRPLIPGGTRPLCYDIIIGDGEHKAIPTKDMYYYDAATLGPITGPDGGFTTLWYCDQCAQNIEFTDK